MSKKEAVIEATQMGTAGKTETVTSNNAGGQRILKGEPT